MRLYNHFFHCRIDLPKYETEKDLRIALALVIQMEVTGFTIE